LYKISQALEISIADLVAVEQYKSLVDFDAIQFTVFFLF